MAWFEDIKSELIITTGEGSEFRPDWLNAAKQKQFNSQDFEFPNTDGTLIIRKRPRSRTYSLELYFQGENHLDDQARFDKASDDPRPWKLSHPFYGALLVQPSAITTDNSVLNVSKITVTIRETISATGILVTISPTEKVFELANEGSEVVATEFENVEIETSDVAAMTDQTELTFARYNKVENSQGLRNQFNKTKSAISGAIAAPITAMRQLQLLMEFPSRFERSTQVRFETLKGEFDVLIKTAENIGTFSYFDRKNFENQSNVAISSMCQAVVIDPDYQTRTAVFKQAEALEDVFDEYIVKLNELQNDQGYFPSRQSLFILENLIHFTVNNLNEIALNTEQERNIILEHDSDVISLAHRFYGLKNAEENIQRIIDTNNIGLNTILEIPKGTELTYYV